MTVGSLFAGIGGFDLGFERAGFDIKWQVEIDPFCRAVLAQHWPTVTRYEDVRTVGGDLEPVDVICGGFPCQDISHVGRRAGLSGARSGLWREMVRALRVVRPRFAVMENVAALLGRGMGTVLGDLADIGHDAEWDCLSACAFGAPHTRDRVFLVAYPAGQWGLECGGIQRDAPGEVKRDVYQWARESMPPRMVDGIPDRMDRVHACGNAVVPQITEWIARRILAAEGVTP